MMNKELIALRHKTGLNKKQLASVLHISPTTLCKIEQGYGIITNRTLSKYNAYFGTDYHVDKACGCCGAAIPDNKKYCDTCAKRRKNMTAAQRRGEAAIKRIRRQVKNRPAITLEQAAALQKQGVRYEDIQRGLYNPV